MEKIIIIGGGAAGCEAAFAARKNAPDAQISIFASENYPPYRRPVLPGVLTAEPPASFWLKKEEIYQDSGVELKLDTVIVDVDIAAHTVTDEDGNIYHWDRLCFAVGALPRMPQVPGTDLEGVYGCRSYDDFKQIQALLKPGVHAVVIGGGVLGLEVAAAMIKAQAHVTVLEFSGRLLPKQLSSSASVVLENTIKNNAAGSIDILCGVSAASIEGKEGGVEAVNLADGRRIPCDIVIAAMGVIPETGLAGKAGLQISNRGIVIDAGCRCVGQKDVFACGDCAVVDGFNPGLFPVAQQQGQTAGSNMTGGDAVFTAVSVPVRLPAFGVKMLSIGEINESDAVEKVSEESASVLRGLYFRDGKCCGAIMLGDLTGQNNIAAIVNTGMDRETALKEGGLI